VKSSVEWTTARKKSFIVSALRAGSRRWPPRFETLADAKTEKKINKATGRLAQHFRCAACQEEFPATMVEVDHIKAVAANDGFTTWDSFIENLFCGKDNLQILCKPCHREKSALEKQKRNK